MLAAGGSFVGWAGGASVLVGSLSGCQSMAPGSALPLRHSGRLALVVAGQSDRSFSAGFELRGTAAVGSLALMSPLGTRQGEASWRPGSVRLSTGEGERRYASLDELSLDLFGESMPVAALFDWLDGHPWAGAPAEAAPATSDGSISFTQRGWQVGTARLGEGLLTATRAQPEPRVTVRVKLDRP
jgi:outer membrane lipoprotein LolB